MDSFAQIQCPVFYNDMASIFLGLFEYVREYKPYHIFVINNLGDQIIIYSSTKYPNGRNCEAKDCTQLNEALKHFRLSTLLFTPYISYCSLSEMNSEEKIKKMIQECFKTDMKVIHTFSMCDSSVYLVVLANTSIAEKAVPVMIDTLFDMAIVQWRDCFKNGTQKIKDSLQLRPIGGSANEMIESRSDYLAISSLFGVISSIASQYYERSKSSGHITVTESEVRAPSITIPSIPFTIENTRQLRKLLEMTRDDFSVLVHDQYAYGIGTPTRTEYSFNISNHMEWSMSDSNNNAVLRYKHGKYYVPLAVEMEGWYITEKLKSMGKPRHNIEKIVTEIRKANHGAILIISEEKDIEAEVQRLCDKKYGMKTKSKIDLVRDCESNNGRIIRAVSAIDGAVFVDFEGFCFGFGIILDGEVFTEGTPARGSRYNSAKNYVAQWKKKEKLAFAYVQSDDGDIDIISSADKSL